MKEGRERTGGKGGDKQQREEREREEARWPKKDQELRGVIYGNGHGG